MWKATFKYWQGEAVVVLSSSVASLYATFLVCVYIAFTFTKLVKFPLFKVSRNKFSVQVHNVD
jgi:hypothetical protein